MDQQEVAPTIPGPWRSDAANGRRKSADRLPPNRGKYRDHSRSKDARSKQGCSAEMRLDENERPEHAACQTKTYTLVIERRMFVGSAGYFL